MDYKLKDINDANDFKDKIQGLKDEMQNRYDKCSKLLKKANNSSSSSLGVISSTAKLVNIATKANNSIVDKKGIVGVSSKSIDFVQDHNDTKPLGRYGDLLSPDCKAYYDTNGVELNSAINQSAICYGNVKNATCEISQQVGENLIKIDTMTNPKNIIDMSNSTYWSQEIITEDKFLPQKTKDNYEVKDGGAFCEIRVKLESIRRINTLKFKPLCKYPLQLCYIKYTQTDSDFEHKKCLQGNFDIPYKNGPIHIFNDGISINFDTIVCKNIYIGFTQLHYENTILPVSSVNIKRNEIPDIKDVKKSTKIFSGYKYEYSIVSVDALYRDYEGIAIYETKSIPSISTINKIYLEEESIHPKFISQNNEIFTDNEYYITTVSDPNFKDWKPLLPINIDLIECERLIDLGGVCHLRFFAEEVISVKCNGKVMKENEYTLKNDGVHIYGIAIGNNNPNLIYTVCYIPIPESKFINFNNEQKKPTSNSEVIHCDESNSYMLKAYPHMPIDNNIEVQVLDTIKNKIYRQRDGRVTNTTGTEEFAFNKNKFQYYIDQNRIFFNQNMEPRYIVKVSYLTLSSQYKIKIILRRNTNKSREVTQHINKINVITENI